MAEPRRPEADGAPVGDLAGVLRHGGLNGCAHNVEGVSANTWVTKSTAERGRMVVGGEDWRRRTSVVDEVVVPVVLAANGWWLRLRNNEVMPMV